MANQYPENDQAWVDERLARLTAPSGWAPDSAAALARLRSRNQKRNRAVRRWVLTTATAAAIISMLLVIPASRACAEQPGACVQRLLGNAPAGR